MTAAIPRLIRRLNARSLTDPEGLQHELAEMASEQSQQFGNLLIAVLASEVQPGVWSTRTRIARRRGHRNPTSP